VDWGREAVEGGSYLLVSDVMEVIDVRLECLTKIKIEIVKADDGNEGCDKRSFEMRQKAKEAEFFSFGTNDLTQTTLGVSRDDAGTFLIPYVDREIYAKDPFEAIDREGVGVLMKMAVEKGRSARPTLKLGICGEHGGEPSSVEFCHQIGLNYVSCSPFRVPIARLAAARAALADSAPAKKKAAPKRKGSKRR